MSKTLPPGVNSSQGGSKENIFKKARAKGESPRGHAIWDHRAVTFCDRTPPDNNSIAIVYHGCMVPPQMMPFSVENVVEAF